MAALSWGSASVAAKSSSATWATSPTSVCAARCWTRVWLVVTGLWSGESFAFDGRHYHLKPAVFRPKPVQHPHIPIWVAGTWPHKRPLARMARWDGMFPLFWGIDDPAEQQAYLRQMIVQVQTLRAITVDQSALRPFDVVVTGETPFDQPTRTEEHIAAYAAAGATWWLESLNPERNSGAIWPFEHLRERVLAGPLGRN